MRCHDEDPAGDSEPNEGNKWVLKPNAVQIGFGGRAKDRQNLIVSSRQFLKCVLRIDI